MTPNEFKDAQRALGMSDGEMAEFLCVGDRNIRRWKDDEQDIPLWIEKFLPAFVLMSKSQTPRCATLRQAIEIMGLS